MVKFMDQLAEVFKQIDWKEIVAAISAIAFLLFALAALGAVFRVKSIVEALREFQRSKSELVGLLDAIDRLEGMTPKLKILATDLQEDISELQRAGDQVVAGQEATKTILDHGKEAAPTPDGSRWLEINTIWREARDEIEAIIGNIEDGRRRRPYNNQSRVSYATVINMLLTGGELTQARADAASQMNQFLLAWKPKKNKSDITEEDVQRFREWKAVFDGPDAGMTK